MTGLYSLRRADAAQNPDQDTARGHLTGWLQCRFLNPDEGD